MQHFQNYYMMQHQGRKLSWLHHLSKGDVRACCMKKRYEFQVGVARDSRRSLTPVQVTSFQMAILLAFNSAQGEAISLETLITVTNLKDTEVKRSVEVSGGRPSRPAAPRRRPDAHRRRWWMPRSSPRPREARRLTPSTESTPSESLRSGILTLTPFPASASRSSWRASSRRRRNKRTTPLTREWTTTESSTSKPPSCE